jgi:hypothetical protein
MSEWKVICRVEDIPVLGSRRVQRGGDTRQFAKLAAGQEA